MEWEALVKIRVQNGLPNEVARVACVREAHQASNADPCNAEKSLYLQELCKSILDKMAVELQDDRESISRYRGPHLYSHTACASQTKGEDLTAIIDAFIDEASLQRSKILQKCIELMDTSFQSVLDNMIRIMGVLDFDAVTHR